MNPKTANNTNTIGAVKLVNAAGGFMANKDDIKKIEPSNPFVSFGYVLLVASLLVSSGIFYYDRALDKKAAVAVEEVKKYDQSLKNLPIVNIHALLDKLVAFNDISQHHPVITSTLRFIETITNKDVYWRNMDYRVNEKNKVVLILSGSTQYLSTVIQQVDEFQDTKYGEYITNVEVSGVGITKKTDTSNQKVDMRIKMEIVKPFSDLNFDKFLLGYVSGNKLQVSTSTTTSTSSNNVLKTKKP